MKDSRIRFRIIGRKMTLRLLAVSAAAVSVFLVTFPVAAEDLSFGQDRQMLVSEGVVITILILAIILFSIDGRHRKTLQERLRRSQELYRTAVNSADLVIWEYDPSSHAIIMSFDSDFTKYVCGVRSFPQILENGPARQAEVIDEECRPSLLEMYRQIDEGAEMAECRYSFLWNGMRCFRHAKATAAYDSRTHRRTAVCISADITTEQQMKDLYQKELQYLHQTNSSALTSKGHHDLTDGKVLEYTVIGRPDVKIPENMTYQEMLSRSLSSMVREEDRASLAAMAGREALLRKYQDGERHLTYKFRRTKVGQAPGWAELQFNTFQSPHTGHIECFVYTYDVTEQELRSQIVSKLVDFGYESMGFLYPDTHAMTAFVLKDPNVSRRCISTSDYDDMLRKVIGTKHLIAVSPEDTIRALCSQTVASHLQSGAPYVYSILIEGSDQQPRRKQMAFSWLSESRETIFFCVSDITDQYQAAQRQVQELSAAKLAAVRANEAKSAFLSSMSHDLRTPLNGILGFTRLALKESDAARKQEYLEKIKLSGALLLSLVNDTLDLSRIESGKMKLEPEEFEGRSLARSVLAAVNPEAELKNIHVIAAVDHFPGGTIYADKLKLQKILLNLLSNAIKYTPPGGTVRFVTEPVSEPGSRMTRRMIIEDNGIGMSREFLAHLYEPFAQERRPEAANVQGTGLGLSIVKRIVDLMDGTILVRSEVGRGTTFTVELPLSCRQQEEHLKEVSECAEVSLDGRRILLAEDNDLNAEIAILLLKDRGMAVSWVENGRQAVDQYRMAGPYAYDAILMDIRMPVMDGCLAADLIRNSRQKDSGTIPIIAMTAEAFEEDEKHARAAGMNEYLTKPIDPKKLYCALVRQLRHSQKQKS